MKVKKMKKFFDIVTGKFIDLNENDMIRYNNGIKIKSKYYSALFDCQEKICYIFNTVKTKKELDEYIIDPENKYVIQIKLNNQIYHDTCNVRTTISFPKNNELNIGDKCHVGALTNCSIIGKDIRGYYYIKYYAAAWEIAKNPELKNRPEYRVCHWSEVFPALDNPVIIEFQESNIRYQNLCIETLVTNYFKFGIDINPEYQRGKVWSEEQQIKLIDSIYKNINIGSICLVEKKWFENHDIVSDMYEILDGKQRLTTIIDYISGKFKYKDAYFHELAPYTRDRFYDQQILVGELLLDKNKNYQYNKKLVLEQFIRLNECGTSMYKSIIDKAIELFNN